MKIVESIEILGVPITIGTQHDVLLAISGYCKAKGQFHIATPNPEMLVEARKNPELKHVLRSTSLNIPDGEGLVWAMRRASKRGNCIDRITGIDTVLALCSREARICPPERIYLLGAQEGVAERAATKLKTNNSSLTVAGTYEGSPHPSDEAGIIDRINSSNPTILFVAFGHPAQELWIARNLAKLRSVKVAIGVGGTFDFLAGKRRRAPVFMRKIKLEWLWRLILEPKRIVRIWRAVVVFPYLVVTSSNEIAE